MYSPVQAHSTYRPFKSKHPGKPDAPKWCMLAYSEDRHLLTLRKKQPTKQTNIFINSSKTQRGRYISVLAEHVCERIEILIDWLCLSHSHFPLLYP